LTRFTSAALDGLDEPVQRYFRHAIAENAQLRRGVRLQMDGQVKVGPWLPFEADERCDGRSFEWRARVGRLLVVVDRYSDGAGSTEGRLFGRRRLFRSDDADTVRSAAGRAALEAIWAPMSLLPERDVAWRAEASDLIVATWDVCPERPEVYIRIDQRGAVECIWAQRWSPTGYRPCGCEVHAERRWGNLVVPSRLSVGWDFGTSDYQPSFRAELRALVATDYA
jgi:hypothetical protein